MIDVNKSGISWILARWVEKSKNVVLVRATPSRVKGSILARSCERFSLMYDVTLTDAISAAEIKMTFCSSSPSAKRNSNTVRTVNQKKVIIGRMIMYSRM